MRRRFIKTTSSKLSQFDINNYITIEALEDNLTISLGVSGRAYYGIDGIGWNEYEAMSEILLNRGQTISFKGTNVKALFYIDKPCNILGNGYSLLAGDNAVNITDISVFGNAILSFSGCPIINVASSFLQATALAEYCYDSMFNGCTSLINAPELPATALAEYCYEYMFNGCTSLINAPELPATALAEYCYDSMFKGCTSLVNAPELPATALAEYCYEYMFNGCTSLVNAPELPATALAEYCYEYMFKGCTSLVNAPELPAKTLAARCYDGMFKGCTSLVNAPELPATTLWNDCYYEMFSGCTSLVNAPKLPALTLNTGCYDSMFNGCTSLVNAPELPALTLAYYCYNKMFYGCSKVSYIKAMFTTHINATDYTKNWVYGVASSGTFVKNKNATWNVTGVNGVPSGWTIQKV